jgi:methylenetetrahydrofolate reductase (NADPH)
MKAQTNLQAILAKGEFAVTCAYAPPCGTDIAMILENAAQLKGKVHAVTVNDNPAARVRMSSWALSKILLDAGVEPILEMVTRDRNRIALQSDLLGASALGIENVVCLAGDHPSSGDHPEAKKVFDLDAVQWITAVGQIRDQGCLMNGKKISGKPNFFVGAVTNPFVESLELHMIHLQKKIAAGAQFIQTLPVLEMERFSLWLSEVRGRALADQCPIIAGVLALKSVEIAEYVRNRVRGITIPDAVIDRLGAVPEDQQQEEGISICIESIEALRRTEGVRGVHILAIGWEEKLPELIERADLLPRADSL